MPATTTVTSSTARRNQLTVHALRGVATLCVDHRLPAPTTVRIQTDVALIVLDVTSTAEVKVWAAALGMGLKPQVDLVDMRMTSLRAVADMVLVGDPWTVEAIGFDRMPILAAEVAALPTDPGGHGCTPDCDCDVAAAAQRVLGLRTADELDGHVRLRDMPTGDHENRATATALRHDTAAILYPGPDRDDCHTVSEASPLPAGVVGFGAPAGAR